MHRCIFTCRSASCKPTRYFHVKARGRSPKAGCESPKFPSRKPQKGSWVRLAVESRFLWKKNFVFRTFDPTATVLQGTTGPECYVPSWLRSCNTRDRAEFNRNHLPRLRSISSVPYIEGTIRLRIMHTVHTERRGGYVYAAFAYASRACI